MNFSSHHGRPCPPSRPESWNSAGKQESRDQLARPQPVSAPRLLALLRTRSELRSQEARRGTGRPWHRHRQGLRGPSGACNEGTRSRAGGQLMLRVSSAPSRPVSSSAAAATEAGISFGCKATSRSRLDLWWKTHQHEFIFPNFVRAHQEQRMHPRGSQRGTNVLGKTLPKGLEKRRGRNSLL